jgi:hypothetical protein
MRYLRDSHQRRVYAMRRLSLAVDRMIRATQPADEEQAMRWVDAWSTVAGLASAPLKRDKTTTTVI